MNFGQNHPFPLGGRTSQYGASVKTPSSKTAIPAAQMLTRDGLAVSKSMLTIFIMDQSSASFNRESKELNVPNPCPKAGDFLPRKSTSAVAKAMADMKSTKKDRGNF